MFDAATERDKVLELLDMLTVNLEVAQQCSAAIKHLDDSAATFEEWCEIRRGFMCLVTQVGMQVDQSLVELRRLHGNILRPPAPE